MHYPIKRLMIKLMESLAEKFYTPIDIQEDLIIIENINYMNDDLEEHQLDIIYPPQKMAKYPIIINIHGGAFCMNSKDMIYRDYGIRLSRNQFVVVNINYTLSTKEIFPAQIYDVLAAIDFISRSASTYQLDVDNVFISGDSAGAYLASMVGCISTNRRLQEYFRWKPTVNIRAIASNCGMYDFETYMGKEVKFPMKKGIVEILFGSKKYKEIESFSYSSVLKHVNKEFPPIYIMDIERNSFAPEARRLEEVLKANGVDYQIHIYDKSYRLVHAFNIMNQYKQSEEVLEEIFMFFDSYIGV